MHQENKTGANSSTDTIISVVVMTGTVLILVFWSLVTQNLNIKKECKLLVSYYSARYYDRLGYTEGYYSWSTSAQKYEPKEEAIEVCADIRKQIEKNNDR